jgi:prophage antirepressor-like protein
MPAIKNKEKKMNELTIFNYGADEVRTVAIGGEPWFVLKDVCGVLGLESAHKVAERLDEDERNQIPLTDNLGRQQNTTVISESGLYNVILRSDKPEAKKFKRWVTHEVLPQIRKTGGYAAVPKTHIEAVEAYLAELKEKERLAFEKRNLQIELDESREYFTVKRVAALNGIYWKKINWKALKNTSAAMELDVRKIFDGNYGKVNAYHISVWKHEYPHFTYSPEKRK